MTKDFVFAAVVNRLKRAQAGKSKKNEDESVDQIYKVVWLYGRTAKDGSEIVLTMDFPTDNETVLYVDDIPFYFEG